MLQVDKSTYIGELPKHMFHSIPSQLCNCREMIREDEGGQGCSQIFFYEEKDWEGGGWLKVLRKLGFFVF